MKWLGLLLLLPFTAPAQKWGKDTALIYLDADLELSNPKKGIFVALSIKKEGGWLVYALYPDSTPVMKAYYKDKNLTIKEGPYTVYYRNNIKAREGYYVRNKMNGNWQFWHPNGIKKDSGKIVDNHLTGLWKSWNENGKLVSSIQFKENLSPEELQLLTLQQHSTLAPMPGVRTGLYTSWYNNGHKESEGNFSENRMDGDWHWYHPNGKPSTIETYRHGTVIGLQCFDTAGRATPDLCTIQSPAQLKLYGNYKEFIYENLTWPEEARKKKIQGDVTVRFQVNREGQLVNLDIQSNQPILKKAVEELFGYMKEWYPAVSHNRLVVWEDEMVIPFRIQNSNTFNLPSSQPSF